MLIRNRTFDAKAVGLYAQDLLQIAPMWKLLAGLRWDRFEGEYRNLAQPANPNNACAVEPATEISRSDSLWSRRFGVLFQVGIQPGQDLSEAFLRAGTCEQVHIDLAHQR